MLLQHPNVGALVREAVHYMGDERFEEASVGLKVAFHMIVEAIKPEEKEQAAIANFAAEILLKHAECLMRLVSDLDREQHCCFPQIFGAQETIYMWNQNTRENNINYKFGISIFSELN